MVTPSSQRLAGAAMSGGAVALATYLGLAAGLIPLLLALLDALAGRQWATSVALGLLLFVVLGLVLRLIVRHPPAPPPATKVFRPFLAVDESSVWPRPDETAQIVNALRAGATHVPLVVGSSGVGKTILLRLLVPAALRRQNPESIYVYVDNYDFENRLTKLVRERDQDRYTVYVLDQFEQWLARLRTCSVTDRLHAQEVLCNLLREAVKADDYAVIIGLRKEWYYDLRFLAELVPAIQETCDIQGLPVADESNETRRALAYSFNSVLGDPALANEVLRRIGGSDRLLPLEAQIVGAVLEQEREYGARVDLEYFDGTLGGVPGIIDLYFKRVLDGTSNRRICLKVLCALSVRTRFRRQEDLSNILARLFEDDQAVRDSVSYLEEQHLVVRRGVGKYELAHDYLAEFFNSKSGAELNPIDRDNILFHLEAGGVENRDVLRVSSTAQGRGPQLGRFVLAPLLVLMLIRLGHFGIPWTLVGELEPLPASNNLLDAAYIPIFIPHAAWIVYVGLFHDRVLTRLRESKAARAFSIFVVLNLAACVLLGIFVPYAWMIAIGWGGTVLGLKLIWLSRRSDLNQAARDRLSVFGSVTTFNMLFLSGLSVAFAVLSFLLIRSPHDVGPWILVSSFFSLMMTYAALALAPVHVSRGAVSQLLGLMGRPKVIPISRAEV